MNISEQKDLISLWKEVCLVLNTSNMQTYVRRLQSSFFDKRDAFEAVVFD